MICYNYFMKQKIFDYTAVFQKEPEGGYTVFVPALPGCVSCGETVEEARAMIAEAIGLYIESMEELHEEVPTEEGSFISNIHISLPYAKTPQFQAT